MDEQSKDRQLTLTVTPDDTLKTATMKLVMTYLQKNQMPPEGVPKLIEAITASLRPLFGDGDSREGLASRHLPRHEQDAMKMVLHRHGHPAVSVDTSIQPDHIVCLEDGKKFKSLKRHLRTAHDMTPDEYRKKWSLAADYPMVAPEYAKQRSELAKEFAFRGADKDD